MIEYLLSISRISSPPLKKQKQKHGLWSVGLHFIVTKPEWGKKKAPGGDGSLDSKTEVASGVHMLKTVFLRDFMDFSTRSEESSQDQEVVGMGMV